MEKKKNWDAIPSLDGLQMDWEYKSESSRDQRSSVRMKKEALAKLFAMQEVPIKVFAEGQTSMARLLDLCAGGLSMGTPVPLAIDLPIQVGFYLGQMKILSRAQVRHVRQAEGFYIIGIKFIDLDTAAAEFIRELYASGVLRHAL